MNATAVWMLLTATGADGVAAPLAAEIGEGTPGIGLRRIELSDASDDLTMSAQIGADRASEILYREQYLRRHLVARYSASAELFNIHGRSADLAFALALAAAVKAAHGLGGEASPILAVTGTLDDTGNVQRIDGIATKLALALSRLPPQSVFVFPRDNESDLPADANARAASAHITLAPVAQLEEAFRLLGLPVIRRNEDEFRLWQDLSREAEQWSRGERALIPTGPQLEAARLLYARHAADWNPSGSSIVHYIEASLRKRDRRRVLAGLALGVPGVVAAGFAGRSIYDYIDGLHRTRITFEGISVPGPDYTIAADPYLRRHGVIVAAREPESSAVVIASNIGLYRGQAVDSVTAQNFLTQIIEPASAPLAYTLAFARPAKSVRLLRTSLWAATQSGVTHPSWRATALDKTGNVLAADGEAMFGSYTLVPEKWFDLMPANGVPIAAVRIASDFRSKNGRPFAGFEAALIQEIQLIHS
jgi:hypothetical protein